MEKLLCRFNFMLTSPIVNNKNIKNFIILSVIVLLFTALIGTRYMTIAAFNYLLILGGFLMRNQDRRIHVRLVSLGILFDLSLVLILQFQRDAIATAMSFKLSPLNQAHIYTSSLATLLYIPQAITGYRLRKNGNSRKLHRVLGYLVIVFRTLGFLLMFSMIDSHSSV
jgi:hypothetical protein